MNGNRKNQPGHNIELTEALVENGSRTFEQEVDKALIANLEVAETPSAALLGE